MTSTTGTNQLTISRDEALGAALALQLAAERWQQDGGPDLTPDQLQVIEDALAALPVPADDPMLVLTEVVRLRRAFRSSFSAGLLQVANRLRLKPIPEARLIMDALADRRPPVSSSANQSVSNVLAQALRDQG